MLRRGIRAQADRLALEARAAIGQDDLQRLDLDALLAFFDIDLMPLSQVRPQTPQDAEQLRHLIGLPRAKFSAALTHKEDEARFLMLVNDKFSHGHIVDSIAHELGHLLLGHRLQPPETRRFSQDEEDEATWLGRCMLVPASGIVTVVRSLNMDMTRAAAHYGIDTPLMNHRWYTSGARLRHPRGGRRARRPPRSRARHRRGR